MKSENRTGRHSQEYLAYIASPEWSVKRRNAIGRAFNRCARCGQQFHIENLEVHHLDYERLGRERDEDLMVVCKSCHPFEDEKRAQRTRSRKEFRRVDGWARKKYGEDWEDWKNYDDVEEEFYEWLERKEEREEDYY